MRKFMPYYDNDNEKYYYKALQKIKEEKVLKLDNFAIIY
jgi:hypothetical protein